MITKTQKLKKTRSSLTRFSTQSWLDWIGVYLDAPRCDTKKGDSIKQVFVCFSYSKVLATVVTDETYYLDLYALTALANRLPSKPLLHCPVVREELPPRGRALWSLPKASWPSTLPDFCTFGFFMFNQETGRRLLKASQALPQPTGRYHLSIWIST